MNHQASQLRLTLSRSHAELSRTARGARVGWRTTSAIHQASLRGYLPIDPPRLTLRHRDRAFRVLAAGEVIGEHVEHEEVGDRRRRLLADRAEAAGGERALAGLPEDGSLGIGRPHRVGVVGIEAVSEIALGGVEPPIE